MKKRVCMLSLSGFIVILDQLTKYLVNVFQPNMVVIPGFFNLTYIKNAGAAFGIFQGKQPFLVGVSLLAMGLLLFLLFHERQEKTGLLLALALILGGTCGNLIDRIRSGMVIDFLLFYIKQYQWPAFNVADSSISIGVGILILVTLLEGRKEKESQERCE
ncbi:lipoprotein signal peptidase [Candidatus Vecturithrix granuli]|uniref:Lipoprotein signal peptidase n=1 Tax=Vecturithrix granuli TaxID=1499967 RepID=A0A081BUW4_VECG1|nr:lipoprotein signal peptidase [Candidatus Vecturithrix granuli]